MADSVNIEGKTRVLDVGAGYGGSARCLARSRGCPVTCLNLSAVQNERNRRLTAEQGLENLVSAGRNGSLVWGIMVFAVVAVQP